MNIIQVKKKLILKGIQQYNSLNNCNEKVRIFTYLYSVPH